MELYKLLIGLLSFLTTLCHCLNQLSNSPEKSRNQKLAVKIIEQSKYMQILYENLQQLIQDPNYLKSVKFSDGIASLEIIKTLHPTKIIHNDLGGIRLLFNTSLIPRRDLIQSIQLVLTLSNNPSEALSFSSIIPKRIGHLTLSTKSGNIHNQLSKSLHGESSFITFKNLISSISFEETEYLDTTLRVFRNHRRKILPVQNFFHFEGKDRPFLLIEYKNIPKLSTVTRNRRSSGSSKFILQRRPIHQRNLPIFNCQLKEWKVRPNEIGLEDVIAPPEIDLGYCSGFCPFPLQNDVYNFTLHSFLIDRHKYLQGVKTPEDVPSSTCVGASWKPLMVVESHYENQQSIQKIIIHKNALVSSCGCRH